MSLIPAPALPADDEALVLQLDTIVINATRIEGEQARLPIVVGSGRHSPGLLVGMFSIYLIMG